MVGVYRTAFHAIAELDVFALGGVTLYFSGWDGTAGLSSVRNWHASMVAKGRVPCWDRKMPLYEEVCLAPA